MSLRDVELLDAAEMSASEVASIFDRSRQAVSKGVRGPRDYFSESEVISIYTRIAPEKVGARERFRNALGELAARVEVATSSMEFGSAVETADRAWLILPDFVQALHDRRADYRALLDKLKSSDHIEVVAFCDRPDGIKAIGREFSADWYEDERIAVVLCDVINTQTPMVILNPHGTPRCFVFAAPGLVPLDSREAVRLVNALAAKVVSNQSSKLDLLVADAGTIQSHLVTRTG